MTSPLDWKVLLRRAHARKVFHGSMGFYLSLLAEVLDPWPPDGAVLEYGSVGPEFLLLANLAFEFGGASGVVLQGDGPSDGWSQTDGPPCRYEPSGTFRAATGSFDAAFSQEALGFLPDLGEHARLVLSWLKPGAVYYAVYGWHAGNPRFGPRAGRLKASGRTLHGHRLEEVAGAFHAAGFEVNVKRLPVLYGVVYDPGTARLSDGLEALLEDAHEHKVLFRCRKVKGPS
jgi:hypothetical protein